MILLLNHWELERDPLRRIVDGSTGYNFGLDCLHWSAPNCSVRLWSRFLMVATVPTGFRLRPSRGWQRVAVGLTSQATSSLSLALHSPASARDPSALTFPFPCLLFAFPQHRSSRSSASAPPSPLSSLARASSLYRHNCSSSVIPPHHHAHIC